MCAPDYFTLYDAALVGPGYMFAAAAIYYFTTGLLARFGSGRSDAPAFLASLVAATFIVWILVNGGRLDSDWKSEIDPPRNQTF